MIVRLRTHSLSFSPSLHSLPSFSLLSPSSPFPFQRLHWPQPISFTCTRPCLLGPGHHTHSALSWLLAWPLRWVDASMRQHAHIHASTHIQTYILLTRAIKLWREGGEKEDAAGTLRLGRCLPRAPYVWFQTSPCAGLAMICMYVHIVYKSIQQYVV